MIIGIVELAGGAVAQSRGLADDLVVGRIDVVGELDLDHRLQAIGRHADRHGDDAAPSLIGASNTRVLPYFCCSPSVTRKTPPK